KRYKPLGKVGVVLATVLLALAPLNLIIDLGRPARFWHLFPYLNPASPVTWGSFLLTLYPINSMIYGYFMYKGNERRTKLFGLIGIPLAVAVHGYTGFILALSKARALWNTAVMPILFLVSAMVSGIALMIIVIAIKDRFFSKERRVGEEMVINLGKILAGAILADLFLIFSDVLVLLTADTEAREAAMLILSLDFSPLFLGVELFLGSLVPLAILAAPGTRRKVGWVILAAILVMIGIWAMRYIMVLGGQAVPLS
ncbi:MAG: NrfD/PsrC family molybdoenzyme membrane anchor subunit, partial [Candidatus Bipolaricaulia bacterium]